MAVKTKWIASLSDGATFVEGLSSWYDSDAYGSPWFQLQKHLRKHDLHITGMRIQVEKTGEPTKTYNLPSMHLTEVGKHKKFNLRSPIVPVGYDYCRWRSNVGGKNVEPYIEIMAIFEGYRLSVIVCELTGNESWAIVHKPKKK